MTSSLPSIDVFASATEMIRALRARRLSAVELLDLHLTRIERYNPRLNAIVIPHFDHAHRVAEAMDAARTRGEDRTPIHFAALVARELGGFRRPPDYDGNGVTNIVPLQLEPPYGPASVATRRSPPL